MPCEGFTLTMLKSSSEIRFSLDRCCRRQTSHVWSIHYPALVAIHDLTNGALRVVATMRSLSGRPSDLIGQFRSCKPTATSLAQESSRPVTALPPKASMYLLKICSTDGRLASRVDSGVVSAQFMTGSGQRHRRQTDRVPLPTVQVSRSPRSL